MTARVRGKPSDTRLLLVLSGERGTLQRGGKQRLSHKLEHGDGGDEHGTVLRCPRCQRAVRILRGNVCAQFSVASLASLSQQVSQALLSKHITSYETPLANDVYQRLPN